MAEIVNLNQYRKRKEREAKESKSAGNRARHGRTKGTRHTDQLDRKRDADELDGKKLEKDDEEA